MALLQAREATMRLFRPMLADHDLTEQQWRVLRALSAASDPLEAGELADRTFLLAPSLSRILTNLEGRSYIERRTHQEDQRRSLLSLGQEGEALVSSIAPKSEAIYGEVEATFGRKRLERLLGELHDLAAMNSNDGQT